MSKLLVMKLDSCGPCPHYVRDVGFYDSPAASCSLNPKAGDVVDDFFEGCPLSDDDMEACQGTSFYELMRRQNFKIAAVADD